MPYPQKIASDSFNSYTGSAQSRNFSDARLVLFVGFGKLVRCLIEF